jgi:hypothetical protein
MKPELLRNYDNSREDYRYAIKDGDTGTFLNNDRITSTSLVFTGNLQWYYTLDDVCYKGNGDKMNIFDVYNHLKACSKLHDVLGDDRCLAFIIGYEQGDVRNKITVNDLNSVSTTLDESFDKSTMLLAVCFDWMCRWYCRTKDNSTGMFTFGKFFEHSTRLKFDIDAISYIIETLHANGYDPKALESFNVNELIDIDEHGEVINRPWNIRYFDKLPSLKEESDKVRNGDIIHVYIKDDFFITSNDRFVVVNGASTGSMPDYTRVCVMDGSGYSFDSNMSLANAVRLASNMDERDFWMWPDTDAVKLMTKLVNVGYFNRLSATRFEPTVKGVRFCYGLEDTSTTNLNEAEQEQGDKKQHPYHAFFRSKLRGHGVNSPSELDDTTKVKFFNEVKKGWKNMKKKKGDEDKNLNESYKEFPVLNEYNKIIGLLLDKYNTPSYTRLGENDKKKFMLELEQGIEAIDRKCNLMQSDNSFNLNPGQMFDMNQTKSITD